MGDLARIVHAYDIRGLVPEELDDAVARALGAAFVHHLRARRIVTAHDMRESSGPLSRAFADGACDQGADVVEVGLASTDMLYFASGSLDLPGAMFTASHNPARYNGIKLCGARAAPIGQGSGLGEIAQIAGAPPAPRSPRGTVEQLDLVDSYAGFLRSLVDLSGIRPLRVVVDAGNGMAGLTVPRVLAGGPVRLEPLYFELDGSFPHHEANPLVPENLRDLQARVRAGAADLGLAFDGDADRCFVVDERGEPVSPSAVTALVATRLLRREPGATVIYNLISSRAVPEIIAAQGGTAVRSRVGHSFIKAEMARTGAIFAGEHSAHYYFRDFFGADTGMLAALHVLAALGEQPGELSTLMARYTRYCASGEINSSVAEPGAVLARVAAAFAERDGLAIEYLDGLSVTDRRWWFNLRPSNTEPLVRLNVEADDADMMNRIRDEVLAIVRG